MTKHILNPQRVESLGPAERIIETLLTFNDHIVHNRPGIVTRDRGSLIGVRWHPATRREDVVYRLDKGGPRKRKTVQTRVGKLEGDGRVTVHGQTVAEYRAPGLFPEAATWLYSQIVEVWKLDNEFAARWASWSFVQEHRDLKVALAALMLVQSRCGDPVVEDGELLFHDDDFRAVGEAMCLLRRRDSRDLNPKLLLRVGDLLALPGVARLNRALGFGRSARKPPMGRYHKAVTRWLRHREQNPRLLQGLMRAGFKTTVMKLARRVGYKPLTPRFFELLRWKQKQSDDGRRSISIGAAVVAAESWIGLSEAQICERIVQTRPNYKRLVGLLPAEIGLTRAIVAAAVEAGCLSDSDLIILTPTLEDLDLLDVPCVSERWIAATEKAEDQRAAHIAERVRGKKVAEKLQDAADNALKKAVAEDVRGLRVYVAVDISASMGHAIEKAKGYLTKFLQGFPLDKLTVAVFNTSAREVTIRHPSAKGVEHAFKGFRAGGGTNHGAAIRDVFVRHPKGPDEDALFIFVGDQQQYGTFTEAVKSSGLDPVAFGFLYVAPAGFASNRAVEDTARNLAIPCFRIEEDMFSDAYAVSRTLRRLIASTPVGARANQAAAKPRDSLVETILKTPLLLKPVWAA
ncbi:MAG: VWA domain-containing protein [Myxococcales bacterium]|nr:VWA domain-containing protein [Myxococcales bacterium]MCB9754276.1 VWA domain-containing protein [Myxococcales bacterium]